MKKHVGVILKKHFSDRPRFVVFDRYEGKLTCTIKNHQALVLGAVVSYFIDPYKQRPALISVHVLDVPLALAREHIVLLHHLLELCFYFLPPRGKSSAVFDLLIFFYKHADQLSSRLHKKIFLFKLFVSFGFYVEHAPLSVQLFHRLSSESIDSLVDSFLHLEIERCIDQWLCCCLAAHPRAKDFKTVRFLKQIGCYGKT